MQNTTIINKIIGVTLCLTLIPMFIIGLIYYANIKSIVENEVLRSYEDMADQYVNSVDFRIDVYTSLLNNIAVSDGVQDALIEPGVDYYDYLEKDKKLIQVINSFSISGNYSLIEEIYIYIPANNEIIEGERLRKIDSIFLEPWFQNINLNQRSIQWINDREKFNKLSFIKPISSLGPVRRLDILGLAKLDVDMDETFRFSDNNDGKGNKISLFVIDESSNIIYTNIENIDDSQLIKNIESDLSDIYNISNEVQGIVLKRNLNFRNWRVYLICPVQDSKDKILNLTILILIVILLLSIISFIFIYLFSKSFSMRFNTIIKKMDAVKNGQLEIDLIIEGNDEIAIVDRNFNDMVSKLKDTINENYVQKIAKREAEFRALQFQINPHFIFNTLECIKSMAIVDDHKDIINITQRLGSMLRYNINASKNAFVTLEEEINQAQNYIEIQKIRMGENLEVFFDIPDEIIKMNVIKFILQPILENVFQHGFHNKRGTACLEITAYEEGNNLVIKISDNGMGIPKKRLSMIENSLLSDVDFVKDGKRKSIGLQNVNTRIKVLYGKNYGVEIRSKEMLGTIVQIKVPKVD